MLLTKRPRNVICIRLNVPGSGTVIKNLVDAEKICFINLANVWDWKKAVILRRIHFYFEKYVILVS